MVLLSSGGEQRLRNVLYGAGFCSALFFLLAPVIFMLLTALSRRPDFLGNGYSITLIHFREILTTPSLHFVRYCINSLAVSLASAGITTGIASCGAYAVTRFPFKGRTAVLLTILSLSMFPQICIAGYLFRIIAAAGMINTWAGLILPYVAWIMPLAFWILISYFAQIPRELDLAAFVDGCSPLHTLVTIIFPLAAPGLFSTLLLTFIFAFNEFMFALMLTNDHAARTVPVGIALFQGLHGEIPWGVIMAASVITTLPVICMTLLFQRRIIHGLTRGAIKG
ncbi:MAG: carbohydrate ABC transporter permease [Chitinispirillaceae bacterium]|nr:carbohydrate ABC transporter permease [Chitinispirillaceae bacterium]